ncbi:MAG: potassium channel protein [Pirellulales bacterium]|nr:potassium channel protein [Pirellulales bacterium]
MTTSSTRPLERILLGVSVLLVILVVATVGYHFLDPSEDRDWLDDLYFVVITISSVGYTEKTEVEWPVQLFTMGVIVLGMSATAYTMGGLVQMITEGEIQRAMGVRRTTREIQRLEGHVILCGYGRIGRTFCEQLIKGDEQFVVIENNASRIQSAQQRNLLWVEGDATHEDVLIDAGIARAKSVVTALPDDAANVFITLTARNLNENLCIVSRAEYPETKKKLIQAGADRVVLPAAMGAVQMARMITHPSTVELMDLVFDKEFGEFELDEVSVHEGCPIVGRTIADVAPGSKHDLLIVAVKGTNHELVFKPTADQIISAGDILLVMGKTADITTFRQEHGIRTPAVM